MPEAFNAALTKAYQIREAEAAHAQYPQYAGHWDPCALVEVTARVRTKLGVAFEAGDIALAFPPREDGDRVVYSWRNKADTVIDSADAREVEEQQEGEAA